MEELDDLAPEVGVGEPAVMTSEVVIRELDAGRRLPPRAAACVVSLAPVS
jgi:hypothetical protein